MKTLIGAVFLFGLTFSVSAAKLTVGLGNFEPYFIKESRTGVFTEIVSKVFEGMPDYTTDLHFGISNKQLLIMYDKKLIDGVSNVFVPQPDSCLTDPVFRFQDVAITKKNQDIAITRVSDIANRSIVTYEGAADFLHTDFSALVGNSSYVELSDPSRQVKMLSADRVDVSIGDLFIFLHYAKKAGLDPAEFDVHAIFPIQYSYMSFRDSKICEAFNQSLQALKQSGEYDRIYDSYLSSYQMVASVD